MRTLVHIGQHKTGTTSLQHFLRDNRFALAEAGLYVPDSLVGYEDPSHFILNVYALDENRSSSVKESLIKTKPGSYFANLRENLEADLTRHYADAARRGCTDVIWSNEGLYLLNSVREYERLRALFEPYSSEVIGICCFRDRKSYRLSRIEELKKQGLSLSDDKDSWRYLNTDSWLFDYERKKELIESVFDSAIVFPYDSRDVIKVFMEKIGYPVDASTASIRMNVTDYHS